jgi:hypothetical protein
MFCTSKTAPAATSWRMTAALSTGELGLVLRAAMSKQEL